MVFGWTSPLPSHAAFLRQPKIFYLHNTDDKNAEAANLAGSQFVSNLIKANFVGERSGNFPSRGFSLWRREGNPGDVCCVINTATRLIDALAEHPLKALPSPWIIFDLNPSFHRRHPSRQIINKKPLKYLTTSLIYSFQPLIYWAIFLTSPRLPQSDVLSGGETRNAESAGSRREREISSILDFRAVKIVLRS